MNFKQSKKQNCQVNLNETWETDEEGLFTGLQRLEVKTSHNMQDKVNKSSYFRVKLKRIKFELLTEQHWTRPDLTWTLPDRSFTASPLPSPV